jgi:cysteine-rich repeat protein
MGWFCALVLAGCNGVLDVGEPTVIADPGDVEEEPGGPIVCGDGVVEGEEQCDDGNATAGDGCGACIVECGPAPELEEPTSHVCYRLGLDQPKDWEGAAQACTDWGGTLAAITTSDELAFVQNRIQDATWIGGRAGNDDFTWITGEPWGFAPWAPGRPAGGGCVHLAGDLGGFEDGECAELLQYLCERAPAGAHTP